MVRIWDDILSEQDKAVIEKAAYARRGNSAFQYLWMKYAEVISTEQTLEYLQKVTGAP